MDVDQAKSLSQKYQVSSMPTFLFLKNGKQLDKLAGANIDAIKHNLGSVIVAIGHKHTRKLNWIYFTVSFATMGGAYSK